MLRQPDKLMLAGDWHGNLPWAFKAINYARKEGADTILHLGDFGWWVPGEKTGQYLREVNAELEHCGIDLYWVDGNHEDHSQLKIANDPTIGGGVEPWSFTDWPRITHLPRGFRWEWWDETWMALGGAHSVDRLARQEGVDWWPEEHLTDEQVEYACRPGPVDVIVAHDCPAGVDIPGIIDTRQKKWNPQMFPESELLASDLHRQVIKGIVDDKHPLAFFHGHYHRAYQASYHLPGGEQIMLVRGLDKDNETLGRNTLFITKGVADNGIG